MKRRQFTRALVVATLACFTSAREGVAQSIVVSQAPLLSSNAFAVNPNILYVLDDSGSMDWDFLPDPVNYYSSPGNATPSSLHNVYFPKYCKYTDAGAASTGEQCCLTGDYSFPCMTVSGNNTIQNGNRGRLLFTNSNFNGIYYNPTVTYSPPLDYNGVQRANITSYTAVPVDGYNVQNTYTMNLTTSYPDIEYCTDSTYTQCLRNDNYLAPNGALFGAAYTTLHATDVSHANNVASTTANFARGSINTPHLSRNKALGPYYYVLIPGEYCTNKKMTSCTTSNAPTGAYTVPATIRWCKDTALTQCQAQATFNLTTDYQYPRYPTWVLTAFGYPHGYIYGNVSAGQSIIINSIKAGTTELLAASITCGSGVAACDTSGSLTAAQRLINVETAIMNAVNDNTDTTNFNSYVSTSTNPTRVYITAPAGTAYNGTNLTVNNSTTFLGQATNGFIGGSNTGTSVPGAFKRVNIVAGQTYGNLWVDNVTGTVYTSVAAGRTLVLDRSGRTDCAAAPTCSYAEEMTNFANWYAYYRTRMQMTKTALSRAFNTLAANKYNIGFFTINSGAFGSNPVRQSISGTSPHRYSTNEFVDIGNWGDTQREIWYNTLFSVVPSGGTPLRQALSRAGLIYAHLLPNVSTDPMQESCQQNFTLLSTDGYWNCTNGSTAMNCGGSGTTNGVGIKVSSNGTLVQMDEQDHTAAANQDGTNPYIDRTGVADTLADVAYFYYNTDLRQSAWHNCTSGQTSHDTCTDDVAVRTGSVDSLTTQHMTTYTIGLGANGVMQYRDGYWNAASLTAADLPDDYSAIVNGYSAPASCLWQAGGTCTWPTPAVNSQNNIDDLWHAAVNGHGQYFSARNPAELAAGLTSALADIRSQQGTGAAASTSSPNVTTSSNFVITSDYHFQMNQNTYPPEPDWYSQLVMQTIDPYTGQVASTVWSAQALLDGTTASSVTSDTGSGRTIYLFSNYHANNLKPFAWPSMTPSDGASPGNPAASCGDPLNEQACFVTPGAVLSQYCSIGDGCLNTTLQALATGQNLVNYLRGDRFYEQPGQQVYRARSHLLGDIVNSEAVYVQSSLFSWDETLNPGYTAFALANVSRSAAVFVGANDGMLHAFGATNGQEMWAYIPTMVLPKLYNLADFNYGHQYYVDGTPVVRDALINGNWKTILVGGLNGGGIGYYALDITDPANPKGLWEFKKRTASCAGDPTGRVDDCDLGYSYGNPQIVKYCTSWSAGATYNGDTPVDGHCASYTWAVLVTSGTDNNGGGGDGVGHLYVLNASTGQIIKKFSTGVGNTTTPSNVGRLNVWVNDVTTDNAPTVAYAGDMQGNLWRFNLLTGATSRLAQLAGNQPITARPEMGQFNQYRVILFPSGRLMSSTAPYDDLGDVSLKGFYAVWDKNDGSTWYPPSGFLQAPITCTGAGAALGGCTASAATVAFDGTHGGWYFNFTAGERGYTDPTVVYGTVVFTSASPSGTACNANGSGRLWSLDLGGGGAPPGATAVATAVSGMPPRPTVVSAGGRLEVLLPSDLGSGSGGANVISGSGLVIGNPPHGSSVACSSQPCPTAKHANWRLMPD